MLNVRGQLARKREWARQVRLALAFERPLTTRMRKEFARVATAAASHFRDSGNIDIHYLQKHHQKAVQKILAPHMRAVMKVTAARVRDALGIGKSILVAVHTKDDTYADEEDFDQFAETYVDTYALEKSHDISETTAKRITKTISNGLDAELSYVQISKNIVEETGGLIGSARAYTIARTEVHSAMQTASLEMARQSGIPGLQKEWNSAGDDRVRDDHAEVDGDVVDLGDTFTVGDDDMDGPGDPTASPEETINCRCALTYVSGA